MNNLDCSGKTRFRLPSHQRQQCALKPVVPDLNPSSRKQPFAALHNSVLIRPMLLKKPLRRRTTPMLLLIV